MKSVIKYRTAGGNTVVWTIKDLYTHGNDPFGSYSCGGCGKEDSGFTSTADKHAQGCRAL
jgi:hypothetical protein